MTNVMRDIQIEKVTLNIGAGKDQKTMERGMKLIKHISGVDPVKTITNKRIAGWGLRAGLPIGCKITLRKKNAHDVLKKLIEAKDNILTKNCFDNVGNISFGIHEYVDIPGIEYIPEIGMMGLQVSITLKRPGFRIKKRKLFAQKIPKKHSISKEDAIAFMKETYKIKTGEDE